MRLGRANRLVGKGRHGSPGPAGRGVRLRGIRETGIRAEKIFDKLKKGTLVDRRAHPLAGLFAAVYSAPMIRAWPWLAPLVFVLANLGRAEDWPQFLGPRRNGTYSGTNIAKAWPQAGPPIRWQHKIGAGFSGPVVQQARLVLFHRIDD